MYVIKTPKIFQPFSCQDLVRLGKNNDGGYLVNKQDVLKAKLLLSLGIGTDISFEKDFTKLNNCKVKAFDKNAKCDNSFFTDNRVLYNKNIGVESNKTEVDIKSLLRNKNIFLKCDIEGDEYKIFKDIITNSSNICGMVIEVHNINKEENFNELFNFISKLNLKLVHTHVNNYFYYKTDQTNVPDILELTFTSSKNIVYNANIILPNELDMPNNPEDKDFKLMF